jgi:lipopolysaccharide export LptBFGC system permease protein LptF
LLYLANRGKRGQNTDTANIRKNYVLTPLNCISCLTHCFIFSVQEYNQDNNNKHYQESKNMAANQNQKYDHYTKVAWTIYTLAAIVLAAVLILFVAEDNEEMIFYGLMTIAAAYVLRPNEKIMGKQILRFTGVSKTTEEE